jgi:acetylornithine deacetylase/succinyl-diaminopimelate desuccinylase family protein
MKERLIEYFREHEGELRELLLALLGEMVAQRTVNVGAGRLEEFPYLKVRGEEYRVGDIVRRELDSWGIRHRVFARIPERPNIIAEVGSGRSGRALLVAAHMDVVPPGDGWSTDPFEMVVDGDRVYGRGVLDNKGPLVAAMLAAKALKEELGEEAIPGLLQVAALADEEASDPDGLDYGIGYLLEEGLIAPTHAIIPDIGENMLKIDIAEKGRVELSVTAVGKQAHGSTPERGVNAITMMARFLARLEGHTLEHTPDPILGGPTVNVGVIRGGAAANIVPAECVATIDLRLVPGQTPEGVVEELRALAAETGGELRFSIEEASRPHAIDPDNELVRAIQANCERFFGFRPEPYGLGGGTFAKGLNLNGIAAVGFGPGDDEAFHVADEFVSIRQLLDFACILCLVALDLV